MLTAPERPEQMDTANINHPPTEPRETPSPLSLQPLAAQPPQPPLAVGRPVLTGQDVSSAVHVGVAAPLNTANSVPHDGIDPCPDQDGMSRAIIDADAAPERVEEPTGFCSHFSSYRRSLSQTWREIRLRPCTSWMDRARRVFTGKLDDPRADFVFCNNASFVYNLLCSLVIVVLFIGLLAIAMFAPSALSVFLSTTSIGLTPDSGASYIYDGATLSEEDLSEAKDLSEALPFITGAIFVIFSVCMLLGVAFSYFVHYLLYSAVAMTKNKSTVCCAENYLLVLVVLEAPSIIINIMFNPAIVSLLLAPFFVVNLTMYMCARAVHKELKTRAAHFVKEGTSMSESRPFVQAV